MIGLWSSEQWAPPLRLSPDAGPVSPLSVLWLWVNVALMDVAESYWVKTVKSHCPSHPHCPPERYEVLFQVRLMQQNKWSFSFFGAINETNGLIKTLNTRRVGTIWKGYVKSSNSFACRRHYCFFYAEALSTVPFFFFFPPKGNLSLATQSTPCE